MLIATLTKYGKAVKAPESWDVGGGILGGSEETWNQFGRLLVKLRDGTLSTADAVMVDKVAKFLAQGMSKASWCAVVANFLSRMAGRSSPQA